MKVRYDVLVWVFMAVVFFAGLVLSPGFAWWNTSFISRQPVNISKSIETIDYHVLIYLPYSGEMQSDQGDVRFVDPTDTTALPFFLENQSSESGGFFWVVSTVNSTVQTIYAYFGNAGASTTSDFYSTFIPGSWEETDGSKSLSDVYSPGGAYSDSGVSSTGAIYITGSDDAGFPGMYLSTVENVADYQNVTATWSEKWSNEGGYMWTGGGFVNTSINQKLAHGFHNPGTSTNYIGVGTSAGDAVSGIAATSANIYYNVTLITNASGAYYIMASPADCETNTIGTTGTSKFMLGSWDDFNDYNFTFRDIRIRKYTVPEPTIVIGDIENYTSGNTAPTLEQIEESPPDPDTYSFGASYVFNVTVCDLDGTSDIDTVLFEWDDGTNSTVSANSAVNDTCLEFTWSQTGAGADVHNYTWFANDSAGEWAGYSSNYTVSMGTGIIYSWSINDTYINFNQSVQIVVNASEIDSVIMTIEASAFPENVSLSWNGSVYYVNIDQSAHLGDDLCYQETANVSTSCGGENTGSYQVSLVSGDSLTNPEYAYDGDWDTFVQPSPPQKFGDDSVSYIYINYTIPSDAQNSSHWSVGTSYDENSADIPTVASEYDVNYSLPKSCFSGSNLRLKVELHGNDNFIPPVVYEIYGYCWTGGSWSQVFYNTTIGYFKSPSWIYSSPRFNEESMYWHSQKSFADSDDAANITITNFYIGGINITASGNSTSNYIDFATTKISSQVYPDDTYNTASDLITFTTYYQDTEDSDIINSCKVTLMNSTEYQMLYSSGVHARTISVYDWPENEYTFDIDCTNVSYQSQQSSSYFIVRQGSSQPTHEQPLSEGAGASGFPPTVEIQPTTIVVACGDGICSASETYDPDDLDLIFCPQDCKSSIGESKVAGLEIYFVLFSIGLVGYQGLKNKEERSRPSAEKGKLQISARHSPVRTIEKRR